MKKQDVIAYAREIGLEAIGFTSADPFDRDIERMEKLEEDFEQTGKGHFTAFNRDLRRRLTPRAVWPEARSIIVSAHPIAPCDIQDKSEPGIPRGIAATNYARKDNSWYAVHEEKLKLLADRLRENGIIVRQACDEDLTKPFRYRNRYGLLLRAAAVRAGIAQRGKNTIVYTRQYGSWNVLSALLTDQVFPPDAPSDPETDCGKCTKCMRICPMDALNRPYVLDAQRCASFGDEVTVNPELPFPEFLRRSKGKQIQGCDLCQSVCPKNEPFVHDPLSLRSQLDPSRMHPDLISVSRSQQYSKGRKVSSYMMCLGNAKDPAALNVLFEHLQQRDGSMLSSSRSYAAWAIGRIGDASAFDRLKAEKDLEKNDLVRNEIKMAMRSLEKETIRA